MAQTADPFRCPSEYYWKGTVVEELLPVIFKLIEGYTEPYRYEISDEELSEFHFRLFVPLDGKIRPNA